MSFVERITGGAVQLGPGTLYRTLARLASDGFVVETADRNPDAPHDARRRYYALTVQGRQAVAAEAALLAHLVEAPVAANLLDRDTTAPKDRSCRERPAAAGTSPHIFVIDTDAACAFYRDVFGATELLLCAPGANSSSRPRSLGRIPHDGMPQRSGEE